MKDRPECIGYSVGKSRAGGSSHGWFNHSHGSIPDMAIVKPAKGGNRCVAIS
jgi:hypothetical protein